MNEYKTKVKYFILFHIKLLKNILKDIFINKHKKDGGITGNYYAEVK